MVTTVCIIHAAGLAVNADEQQLTGIRPTSQLVTLSVCVTDIDAGLVTEYTCNSFLFAVWPFLIALCIERHLISLRSQLLEMALNGTGQSNKEAMI